MGWLLIHIWCFHHWQLNTAIKFPIIISQLKDHIMVIYSHHFSGSTDFFFLMYGKWTCIYTALFCSTDHSDCYTTLVTDGKGCHARCTCSSEAIQCLLSKVFTIILNVPTDGTAIRSNLGVSTQPQEHFDWTGGSWESNLQLLDDPLYQLSQ